MKRRFNDSRTLQHRLRKPVNEHSVKIRSNNNPFSCYLNGFSDRDLVSEQWSSNPDANLTKSIGPGGVCLNSGGSTSTYEPPSLYPHSGSFVAVVVLDTNSSSTFQNCYYESDGTGGGYNGFGAGGTAREIHFGTTSGGLWTFSLQNGSGGGFITGTESVVAGKPTVLVVRVDYSENPCCRLWVDGIESGSLDHNETPQTATFRRYNVNGASNRQWDGNLYYFNCLQGQFSRAFAQELSLNPYQELVSRFPDYYFIPTAAPAAGLINKLAGYGGLAGKGGLAGRHGGLAG